MINTTEMRRIIIEQSYRAGVGHIGSALSVVEIIAAIYSNPPGGLVGMPHDRMRDRFVLSKGHAALALYAALFLRGFITKNELNSYCGKETLLGVHPDHNVFAIDFSTGSLGHGLGYAAGAALAGRIQNDFRRAFVLMSDAELNEGSVWEAAMFAAHHKLSNLIAVVDMNGQQAMGDTNDIIAPGDMAAKWTAFGWRVIEVDGHDLERLHYELSRVPHLEYHTDPRKAKPTVILASTIFGRGVSFMEKNLAWHYTPLDDAFYKDALEALKQQHV